MSGGGGAVTPQVFSEQQLAELAELLSENLTPGNIDWLGDTVLNRDVSVDIGSQVGNTKDYARLVVDAINAEGAIARAIAILTSETDRNGLLVLGLNCILQGESLKAAAYQKFKSTYQAFISSKDFEQMFPKVRRAVCAIGLRAQGYDKIIGSGFLIAPDKVMTNYHVLESFIDETTNPISQKGKGTDIWFFFDYETAPEPSVPTSPLIPTQVAQGADDWLVCASKKLKGDGTAQPAQFAGERDFVVIKLRHAIGNLPARASGGARRGWLTVPSTINVLTTPRLVLFQHPAAKPQKFDIGPFHRLGNVESRVWYWLDTAGGSSGGAAVDTAGNLFAIHNAAVVDPAQQPPAGGPASLNQGIRIDHIHAELIKVDPGISPANTVAAAAVPLWSLTDDMSKPIPVIGRATFRTHVEDLRVSPSLRVLVVSGPEHSGVSFSSKLLQRVLGGQTPTVVFSPKELRDLGPRDFATVLLEQLGVTEPGMPIPNPAEDIPSWIRGSLAPELIKKLAAEATLTPKRFPAWVVVDTIGAEDKVTQWATNLRECIAALVGVRSPAQQLIDVPQLRWVFLTRKPETLPLGTIARKEEDLSGESDYVAGFEQCLQAAWEALDQNAAPLDKKFLSAMARKEMKNNPTISARKVLAACVKDMVQSALENRGQV